MIGIALAAFAVLALGAPIEIHVSPGGDDGASGMAEQPLLTLPQAQSAVREMLARDVQDDIVVVIHDGVYELDAPLVFGPEDGGNDLTSVIYRAEPPGSATLSGGSPVSGWTVNADGLWVAAVPEGRAFRQLFVNGRRAVRARTPNGDAAQPYGALVGATLEDDRSLFTLQLPEGQVGDWGNLGDVEIVVIGNWEVTRKRLAAADPLSSTLTLAPPHAGGHDAIRPGPGRFYYLENAREFLDEPGEWYLDRTTGVVTYWPLPDEDIVVASVVAPRIAQLLQVVGTAEEPVRELHFDGLRLAHTDWDLPEFGFNGIQASHHCIPAEGARGWAWTPWSCIESTVEWRYAQGCSFTNGALEYLGNVGMRVGEGCTGNVVEGNHVHTVGANGIMVGEDLHDFPWGDEEFPGVKVPRDNRVANNLIHDCGLDDYGAVGIWVAFTDGTTVANNLIYDMPYTGISVGFLWDETPTCCANNLIEANHVHNVLQKLCDGGCIYTLGLQPGTVLRGNWLHDALRSGTAQGAPNNGIFFDQGSKGFTVERNLIHATAAEPIRFNQCAYDWHSFADNILGGPTLGEGKVGLGLAGDGSGSFLEVPHSAELEPDALTVAAWVRIDELPTGGDTRRWVVAKNRNEWEDGHYGLCLQGGKLGAYSNIGGGQANAFELWSNVDPVTLGEWHLLALTYDGDVLRIHCDGIEVGSLDVGRPRTHGSGPLAIARRPDGYVALKGAVDEVLVAGEALTSHQIQALFAADGAGLGDEVAWVLEESFEGMATAPDLGDDIRSSAGLQAPYADRLLGELE